MALLVTDGDHLKRNYKEEGILFLTSENFTEFYINYDSPLRIDAGYEKTLSRARSEPQSIFLTKTGRWYGKAAVCPESCPVFNISADVAKIRLRPGYDPFFLACYLNSTIGYGLVRRESTGATRDRIILENLKNLPVPQVKGHPEYKRYVMKIWEAKDQALELQEESSALLLSALGIDALDLSQYLSYEKNYSSMSAAGRLDAEYFSPRYQRVLERLGKDERVMGDVVSIAERRFIPSLYKENTKFSYIEIGSLSGDGWADAETLDIADAPSRAQWIVQPHDIITSTVRPIRRLSALISDDQAGYICSSGFAVLQPEEIEPEVLLAYLRLPIICEILDLHTTASMYPAVSIDRLLSIPFPNLSKSVRDKIVANVRLSHAARRKANQLLSEVKSAIEQLILASDRGKRQ